MSRKKKQEVEYEVTEVSFETPAGQNVGSCEEVPTFCEEVGLVLKDTFDAGYCWCLKNIPGCAGNPTKVVPLGGKHFMFVCPHGRDETSVKPKVFEAAKKAGLVS